MIYNYRLKETVEIKTNFIEEEVSNSYVTEEPIFGFCKHFKKIFNNSTVIFDNLFNHAELLIIGHSIGLGVP